MNTDYSKMSRRERKYLRIMQSKYLVLNLLGAPGLAKSAIIKSIADKIGAEFVDLRLASMDETDLGVFPYLKDAGPYKVNSHAIPEWADLTKDTTKTFIIAFEELNRASKSVRDAALGVLLERRIGPHFMFGANVLMCATGNLGSPSPTTSSVMSGWIHGHAQTSILTLSATWKQTLPTSILTLRSRIRTAE
jgi:hypothetical protein